MISIKEFCKLHDACRDGRDWALANCKTMADVWLTARPDWLVWVATRPGVLDDRTLRLFAVDCDLLTDDRCRSAIDVAERFANGEATPEKLQAARGAVVNVMAWASARAAWGASAEARGRQAIWLRQHCKPNFSTGGE